MWGTLLGGLGGGLLGSQLGKVVGGGSGKKWASALGGLGGAALGGYAATSAADGGGGLFDSTQQPAQPAQGVESVASPADMGNTSNFGLDGSGGIIQPQAQPEAKSMFDGIDGASMKDWGAGLTGVGNLYTGIEGTRQSKELLDLQKQQVNAGLLNQKSEAARRKTMEGNMSSGFGNYYYA